MSEPTDLQDASARLALLLSEQMRVIEQIARETRERWEANPPKPQADELDLGRFRREATDD